MKTSLYILSCLLLLQAASCKKFVDVHPTDRTTRAITFESVENATAAVNGMYYSLATGGILYSQLMFTNIPLMSDELKTVNIAAAPFAVNSVTPQIAGLEGSGAGFLA